MKLSNVFLLLIALLAFSHCGEAQIQKRFALPASFDSVATVIDTFPTPDNTSYVVVLAFQSDQSGNGYLANQVETGWRILTSTGRQYTIDTVRSTTFSSAELVLRSIGTTSGTPSGVGMVYQYDGTAETLPMLPSNSTGIPQNLVAAILTHNAQISTGPQMVNYGRIRYCNRAQGDNATAVAGDPTKPWVDWVAAHNAPGLQPGDVIHTYNSEYNRGAGEITEMSTPMDNITFSFDNVSVTYPNFGSQAFLFKLAGYVGAPANIVDTDGSGKFEFTVRGNLRLQSIGIASVFIEDANPVNDAGDTIPELDMNVEVGEWEGTQHPNYMLAVNGSGPNILGVNAYVRRIIGTQGSVFSTGYFNDRRFRPMPNRRVSIHIGEITLSETAYFPNVWRHLSGHHMDESELVVRVDRVVAPPYRHFTPGSASARFARLFATDAGSKLTNSSVYFDVGSVIYSPRGTDYPGQGAKDYSDPATGSVMSENARMFRFNGEFTNTVVHTHCGDCQDEDGSVLVDNVTGGGGVFTFTGSYRSERQSAVKLNQPSASDVRVHLDGRFYSKDAPAVSSGLTAQPTSSPSVLSGYFATGSSLFPAIALNRPFIVPAAYVERLASSGSRPAIESNTAATSLQYGRVNYVGPGTLAGPNLTIAALKSLPETP